MSRQSNIMQALAHLVDDGRILAYHRDYDPDQDRVQWLVAVPSGRQHYYTTGQVEAFIEGAKL